MSQPTRKGGAKPALQVIGWREWLCLPELGVDRIKVKVDTGARTSSLHAYDLEPFRKRGGHWVRFKVHPIQRSSREVVEAEAEVLDQRDVRSSSGDRERRWTILTEAGLLEQAWPVELTLASRDAMGFRMLLGREALRGRFLVDAGRSFLAGVPLNQPRNQKKRT